MISFDWDGQIYSIHQLTIDDYNFIIPEGLKAFAEFDSKLYLTEVKNIYIVTETNVRLAVRPDSATPYELTTGGTN